MSVGGSQLGSLDLGQLLDHALRLAIAYALAVPIGWEREVKARSAGLRTFPLIALASCGYMLTAISALSSPEAQSRIAYGLITGVGFIGGGAILKEKGAVVGTATAASIWNTGAIGMAVAYDRLEIAILLAAINLITLRVMGGVLGKHDPDV